MIESSALTSLGALYFPPRGSNDTTAKPASSSGQGRVGIPHARAPVKIDVLFHLYVCHGGVGSLELRPDEHSRQYLRDVLSLIHFLFCVRP